MKKILFSLILVLSFYPFYGQSIVPRGGSANTPEDQNLFIGKSFRGPVFSDTTAANAAHTLDSAGKVIFTYNTNSYWYRQSSPKKWVEFLHSKFRFGQPGEDITATSDRSFNSAGFNFTIQGTNQLYLGQNTLTVNGKLNIFTNISTFSTIQATTGQTLSLKGTDANGSIQLQPNPSGGKINLTDDISNVGIYQSFFSSTSVEEGRTGISSEYYIRAEGTYNLSLYGLGASQYLKFYHDSIQLYGGALKIKSSPETFDTTSKYVLIVTANGDVQKVKPGLVGGGGGGGGVTAITQGLFITLTPNPITGTGTIKVDTTASGASGYYLRRKDSLTGTNIPGYMTGTSGIRNQNSAAQVASFFISGTAKSSTFITEGTTSGNVTIESSTGTYNFNLPISAGTSGQALFSGGGGGSPMTFGSVVTSVATNTGTGITGGTITTTGTLAIDTTLISTRAWLRGKQDSIIANYVPIIRTITINGTTQNLSANRIWSVGTLTGADTTSLSNRINGTTLQKVFDNSEPGPSSLTKIDSIAMPANVGLHIGGRTASYFDFKDDSANSLARSIKFTTDRLAPLATFTGNNIIIGGGGAITPQLVIDNPTTTGTIAQSQIAFRGVDASGFDSVHTWMGQTSNSYTFSPTLQNTAYVETDLPGGFAILSDHATTGNIDFYTGGYLTSTFRHVRIMADGTFITNGPVTHDFTNAVTTTFNLTLTSEPASAQSYIATRYTVPTTGVIAEIYGTANNFSAPGLNVPANSLALIEEASGGSLVLMSGAGDIRFNAGYSSAAEMMRINSSGVGIGTNNPLKQLHTVGTVRMASLGTASSDTTTYKPVGINSSGDIIGMTYWPGSGGGGGSGTVTSVATGYGLTGGTITTTGTLVLDSATVFPQIRNSLATFTFAIDKVLPDSIGWGVSSTKIKLKSFGWTFPAFLTDTRTGTDSTMAHVITLSNESANTVFGNFTASTTPPTWNQASTDNTFLVRRSGTLGFGGLVTADMPSSVSIIQGTADLTGQTSAGTITTFTVGASTAAFNVSAYLNITAVSTDVIQVQVTYTDENSSSQTVSFTTISTVTNSTYNPVIIRAKTGTVITVKTNLTVGAGSITFDAGARIIQL